MSVVLVTGAQGSGTRWVRDVLRGSPDLVVRHDGRHGLRPSLSELVPDLVVAVARNPYAAVRSILKCDPPKVMSPELFGPFDGAADTYEKAVALHADHLAAVMYRYPQAMWVQYEEAIEQPHRLIIAVADRCGVPRWEVPEGARPKLLCSAPLNWAEREGTNR